MYCVKCGKEFPDEASYCPYCGDATLTAAKHHNAADPLANYHPVTPPNNLSQSAASPNPIAGFVLSIVGVAFCIIAWIDLTTIGYLNNPAFFLFDLIGLGCGIAGLVLVIKHKKAYKLHGVGIVAMILSITALALACFLLVDYVIVHQTMQSLSNAYLNSVMDLID